MYYGVSKDNVYQLYEDIQFNKKLFKNKLSGERQNPRFLSIKRIMLQMKVIQSRKSNMKNSLHF
jgi:hypothetical protein